MNLTKESLSFRNSSDTVDWIHSSLGISWVRNKIFFLNWIGIYSVSRLLMSLNSIWVKESCSPRIQFFKMEMNKAVAIHCEKRAILMSSLLRQSQYSHTWRLMWHLALLKVLNKLMKLKISLQHLTHYHWGKKKTTEWLCQLRTRIQVNQAERLHLENCLTLEYTPSLLRLKRITLN